MPTPSKKRRRGKEKGGAVEPRLARLSRTRSAKAAAKPVYLVVEHDVKEPTHSVLDLGAGAVPRPLLYGSRGMSFAAVESPYGPRIVGVGGVGGRLITTVYDPKTSTEIPGPLLVDPKLRPVLIPHGSKLYALSRSPSVVRGVDFVPWFVVLDLNKSFISSIEMEDMGWHDLPPPPIFPCRLNPLEYCNPPEVRVASYAVVGSHILISVEEDKGTCAFDMDTHEWEMVDDRNLPFIGEAVPLGGHLFVACSKANGGAAAVYSIKLFPPTSSGKQKTELSILELPVASKGIVPGQLLCALGKSSFSSFDIRSASPGPEAKLHKARIVHRTYSQTGGYDTEANYVTITKQQRQIYKLLDRSHHLAHPSPVVAALTM